MTINKIKDNIGSNIGKKMKVIYNGSRNKTEEYEGIISEIYDSIFILKLDSGLNKSFSYTDILVGVIDIEI